MLRMRLQRRGKKNYATYRVVIADRKAPVKGRFVADLGPYNPHTDEFGVDKETALKWLSNGVQPSATVHNLMVQHGILKADKVTSWRPKKRESQEGTESEVKPAEAKTEEASEEKPEEAPDKDTEEEKEEK